MSQESISLPDCIELNSIFIKLSYQNLHICILWLEEFASNPDLGLSIYMNKHRFYFNIFFILPKFKIIFLPEYKKFLAQLWKRCHTRAIAWFSKFPVNTKLIFLGAKNYCRLKKRHLQNNIGNKSLRASNQRGV